jgi:hypothetical protein
MDRRLLGRNAQPVYLLGYDSKSSLLQVGHADIGIACMLEIAS